VCEGSSISRTGSCIKGAMSPTKLQAAAQYPHSPCPVWPYTTACPPASRRAPCGRCNCPRWYCGEGVHEKHASHQQVCAAPGPGCFHSRDSANNVACLATRPTQQASRSVISMAPIVAILMITTEWWHTSAMDDTFCIQILAGEPDLPVMNMPQPWLLLLPWLQQCCPCQAWASCW